MVGNGYVRKPVSFTTPLDGVSTNAGDVIFPTATADWALSRDFGIFDSLVGGNLLYFNPLAEPRTVILGATLVFFAGQLALVET